MDKREILDFMGRNPVTYMATVDGNKPHVRAMRTYWADEDGILFVIESVKDVYKELLHNPETDGLFPDVGPIGNGVEMLSYTTIMSMPCASCWTM